MDSPAIEHAIAHHLLEGARLAAAERDAGRLAWCRGASAWDVSGALLGTAAGAVVTLRSTYRDLVHTDLADTGVSLWGEARGTLDASARNLLAAAFAEADGRGFGQLVREHAPVVCLMEKKTITDELLSWSTTRLPGTVYCDYTDNSTILARDVVHEAAHNWLNAALTLYQVSLPADRYVYSPWRKTDRPVFGFLHACWAFSCAATFLEGALAFLDGRAHRFAEVYLTEQHALARSAETDFRANLELVTHDELRSTLEQVFYATGAGVRQSG